MNDAEPTTPFGDVVVGEGDGSLESHLPPSDDGAVVLAQFVANLPRVSASNPPVALVNVENPHS